MSLGAVFVFGRDSISQAFRFPRRELFLPWTAGSALSIKERPNDYYVTGSGDTIVRGLPPPAEQVWRSFGSRVSPANRVGPDSSDRQVGAGR